MKEVFKEKSASLDHSLEECCSIAESMIEEIHLITLPESETRPSGDGRHKGSLKRKLMRQIRQAREVAMIG